MSRLFARLFAWLVRPGLVIFVLVAAVVGPPWCEGQETNRFVSRTNQVPNLTQRAEQTRGDCVRGRRMVCGKIIQIRPDGLVIESGYANLLRSGLSKSWLIPGNASASRNPQEVEGSDPGALCVGRVFLTDIPKKPVPGLHDYVVLQAYPAGQYVYQPVTNVQKTIRRFSVGLETAVRLSLQAGEK